MNHKTLATSLTLSLLMIGANTFAMEDENPQEKRILNIKNKKTTEFNIRFDNKEDMNKLALDIGDFLTNSINFQESIFQNKGQKVLEVLDSITPQKTTHSSSKYLILTAKKFNKELNKKKYYTYE